jgi:large subunit ribosomal protein L15
MPLQRRVPKRGFTNPFRVEYAVVNLDALAARFESGVLVTPEILHERGLVRGKRSRVKVLARGDMDKALTIQAHRFSAKAVEKITAAGGTVETLGGRPATNGAG